MGFLCFIVKRGKLSEIDIDVDKDWRDSLANPRGITNIKQVAASMSKGDLVVKDTTILVRIPPGGDGLVLTSKGIGKIPVWAPAGGALKYYFPVEIVSTHAEAKPSVDRSIAESAVLATAHAEAYDDQPGLMIKRLTPTIVSTDAEAIVTPDRTHNVNAPLRSDISMLVDGAVSETAVGVQTDETAAARDPAANDMHLCPMTPAVGDKYYIGFSRTFRQIWINIGTAGAGNWANLIEYWNGAWVPVVNEEDGSNDFTLAGMCHARWDMPGDWVQTIIQGMNLYWIRFRTSAFINQTTAPLGSQAWCCIVS